MNILARWQEEQCAWLAYITDLDEDELNKVWREDDHVQRTRWQTILHVINGGTYHRSEAAAMLTGYGQSPGELDFEGYLIMLLTKTKYYNNISIRL